MGDNVQMWITGSSALAVAQAGKWRNQNAVKPGRSAKVAGRGDLQLSTQNSANVFPGTGTLQPIGLRQSTNTARNIYLAFGYANIPIA